VHKNRHQTKNQAGTNNNILHQHTINTADGSPFSKP